MIATYLQKTAGGAPSVSLQEIFLIDSTLGALLMPKETFDNFCNACCTSISDGSLLLHAPKNSDKLTIVDRSAIFFIIINTK